MNPPADTGGDHLMLPWLKTLFLLVTFAEEDKQAPKTVQVTPASDSEPSKDKQKADAPQDGQVFEEGS